MPGDNVQLADQEASNFEGFRVTHAWDQERELGTRYAKTLNLSAVAWDAYFLYAPGVAWEGNEPPQPTFWMHQLPSDTGANRDLVLYPTRLSQELLSLLGSGVEPRHTSRAQLGLQLHVKGLASLMKDRAQQSLQEMEQAVEDSKLEA